MHFSEHTPLLFYGDSVTMEGTFCANLEDNGHPGTTKLHGNIFQKTKINKGEVLILNQ